MVAGRTADGASALLGIKDGPTIFTALRFTQFVYLHFGIGDGVIWTSTILYHFLSEKTTIILLQFFVFSLMIYDSYPYKEAITLPEVKKVSPLLDEFALGRQFSDHHGVSCYPAVHTVSNEKFILKHVSIPESQTKVDALLLTGACQDRTAAQAYFEELAQSMVNELEVLKELSQTRAFAPVYDYQLTPKDRGQVGMDLWILTPYRQTLAYCLRRGGVTHLDAVNMGIDVCAALTLCRKMGFLYQNLRPENIYITPQRRFQLGDLGLLSLDELAYSMLPDRYRSDYTPPELADAMAELGTTIDIYALGVVMYQVYNGGALPDLSAVDAYGQIPAPAYADEEMTAIIARAITADTLSRWQNPEELGQALVSYLQRNVVNDDPITPEMVEAQALHNEPEAGMPADGGQTPQHHSIPQPVPVTAAPGEPEVDFTPEPELGFTPVEPELAEGDDGVMDDRRAEPVADTEMEDILTRAQSFMPEDPAAQQQTPTQQQPDSSDGEVADPAADDAQTPETQTLQSGEPEEEEEEDEETTDGQKRVFRRVVAAISILVCLALAFMGGYFYYQNIYCVAVESFQAVDSTLDTLTVQVDADGREDKLAIHCQDAFGNAYPASILGGKATFTGLQPNTQYIITLDVEGFHRLVGKTSISFTTAIQTEIADLSAITGAEDGSVIISFTPNGTEPDTWLLTYSAEGEEEKTVTFTDHVTTINGLTVGKDYTFTLTADNDIFLSGTTTLTHRAMAVVTAQNITLSQYDGANMTISWDEPETPVGSWTVRCYNASGYDNTLQTETCSVSLQNMDPVHAYSFEVTAEGMTESAVFALTATPIFISEVLVDGTVAGEATVSWNFAGSAPEKWLVMYWYNSDPNQIVAIQTDNPMIMIEPILPGATYNFQIQPADGSSVFNGAYTATTAEAPAFNAFGITGDNVTISTFVAPTDPDWTSGQVPETLSDTFKVTDIIAFALEITSKYDYSDAEVETIIVIRNADGEPVDYNFGTAQWHTMWTKDIYLGQTNRTPQTPGEYTLEIYFNNQLVSTKSFTITA